MRVWWAYLVAMEGEHRMKGTAYLLSAVGVLGGVVVYLPPRRIRQASLIVVSRRLRLLLNARNT